MGVIEIAISWMENNANDNSHGYDQNFRWGPDYDCSSAVITAWENAGVPVKSKGGATYTGNMYDAFISNGFEDVTAKIGSVWNCSKMKRGDVLLNHQNHVAMYCGNGLMVEASLNEKGGITGGQTGDQTGREFRITNYSNYYLGWDCVLRYKEYAQSEKPKEDKHVIEINITGTLNKLHKWTGEVTADELNVRQWAGTEYSLCSFSPLYEGEKVTVCDSIYASDYSVWHYILKGGKYGFVHGDYIRKV